MQWLSIRGDFDPDAMSGDIFSCHNLEGLGAAVSAQIKSAATPFYSA